MISIHQDKQVVPPTFSLSSFIFDFNTYLAHLCDLRHPPKIVVVIFVDYRLKSFHHSAMLNNEDGTSHTFGRIGSILPVWQVTRMKMHSGKSLSVVGSARRSLHSPTKLPVMLQESTQYFFGYVLRGESCSRRSENTDQVSLSNLDGIWDGRGEKFCMSELWVDPIVKVD